MGRGRGRGRGYATGPLDKKTLGRALKYVFGGYPIQLIVVALLIGLAAVVHLRGTLFMRELIDVYILPMLDKTNPDYRPLAGALGKLALLYLAGILANYFYHLIMIYVSQGTLAKIRNEVFTHMQKLPIRYFDTHERGDVMSVYTNDVDAMREIVGRTIPQVLNSGITVVITFISMVKLSIPMTCMSILAVCVQLFAAKKLGGLSRKYFFLRQTAIGKANAFVEETLEGEKVVKVFCHEDHAIKEFDVLNENMRDAAAKANIYSGILMPVNGNIGNIAYVLMAVIGGAIVINGTFSGMTLGMLIAFLSLSRSFSRPITQVSQQVNSIALAMAGAARIFEVLDAEPEVDEGRVELVNASVRSDGTVEESSVHTGQWAWKCPQPDGTVTYVPMRGQVSLNDVVFSYDGEKEVLHGVSLYGDPGEKIAFVGSTGAGKTTITNLLNRFYDIDSGRITIDGIDIKDLPRDFLRQNIAMVLQDTHLFTGTVRENIRYGRLDATDEEVEAAARMASADSFIRRLADGYDTVIEGDGANLSQGQRQLLNIARAAISHAPILVLDEATSSVDTRTERHIEEGMDHLMQNRTTFVIAHRLSTVRNANAIMVLENGEIVERGDHDDLLAMQGRYYELYTGKSELT